MRGDASSLSFEVFSLVLSIAAETLWDNGQMYIKAAYLQAKWFYREIYFRPPREANSRGDDLKLQTAAYGLVDIG